MKLETKFMNSHPYRKNISDNDYVRIKQVLKGELPDENATVDECEAILDIIYDAIVVKTQTHPGVITLQ